MPPLLRPAAARKATSTRCTLNPSLPSSATRAHLSTSSRRLGGGHKLEYEPPSGWLFNVPPGQKYQKEGWETIWHWGFFGSLAFGIVGYCFKPDTSIQTWALEEARRRLEAEGILPDPDDEEK